LGTALTENQLALLWRMADEPILCFDGDRAGQKAAWRAADLALPHLKPGKSLRFALLPEGQDPDDLARSGGRGAIEEVIAAARGRKTGMGGQAGFAPPQLASPQLASSLRGKRSAISRREALILQSLLNHPWLLHDHLEEVAALELAHPEAPRLRAGIIAAYAH